MDNLDSYIYIILSILFVAFSALRKKKKQVDGNEHIRPDKIESIFDLLNQENMVQQNQFSRKPKIKDEEIQITQKIVTPEKTVLKQSNMRKPVIEKNLLFEKEEETDLDFDLKEAVIYAEILNRKTF
jgi:hypothetical protein